MCPTGHGAAVLDTPTPTTWLMQDGFRATLDERGLEEPALPQPLPTPAPQQNGAPLSPPASNAPSSVRRRKAVAKEALVSVSNGVSHA